MAARCRQEGRWAKGARLRPAGFSLRYLSKGGAFAYLRRGALEENLVRSLIRIALVVAMGLGVSACDKCGNWFKYDAPKSCGTQPVGQ